MKVLFVGGGKRVELAQQFIKRGHTVDAYELDQHVPIATEAGRVIQGYSWNDPRFFSHLFTISQDYDLILPLHDGAVEALSGIEDMEMFTQDGWRSLQKFCVSSKFASDMSCDKSKLEEELRSLSWYPSPKLFQPAIIKPSKGFSSKGIKISNRWLGFTPKDHVAQRFIPGGKEYTIDCYFSRIGRLIDWVPRRRLEVSSGEVTKSITVAKRSGFERILWYLEQNYDFRGPVTVQVIEEEHKKTPHSDILERFFLMEINARLGGGATLSLAAGFDMIKLLEFEYSQNKVVSEYTSNWREGVYLARSYRDAVFDMNSEEVREQP